ncbi:MAG: non-heme iron oxygenase ferredoxin subunit [Anaerolineales bacterium]|nr:non-heme iron oxygenase ferredoxin subunit [Anaerolineales bacterium]
MGKFVKVAAVADLPPGERLIYDFDYDTVIVFNVDGHYYAIADLCTHDDGPLADGVFYDHCIVCPRHGAEFDVRSGEGTAPAFRPVPTYAVKIEDNAIWVEEPA